jgi:alpha-L-fucosidase
MDEYRAYVKAQLSELLTSYGKIYTLFWDIPTNIEDKSMNEFVRSLQPEILINDRGWDKGDFSTPERSVPDGARFERMTEACQSVGEQAWGYRADEDYFSVRFLTSSIDKIMAMGGSYLLNVGPTHEGEIPSKAKEIIKRVGDWYTRTRGVLENHSASKIEYKLRGGVPFVATEKDGKTYIHLYKGIHSSAIAFENSVPTPKRATLINDGRRLRVRKGLLPGWGNGQGYANGPFVSIADIPTDEFESEPMIIEIEW